LFFTKSNISQPTDEASTDKENAPVPDSPVKVEKPIEKSLIKKEKTKRDNKKSSNHDTVIPRHHDTMTPRNHDTVIPQVPVEIISHVRKAVKEFGKEAATHRFTEAEKREIADLIYTYKNTGIKTSENEITRIAVNYIVEDYKENGENSVLHKILQALNE
jgi:hypothetical protein